MGELKSTTFDSRSGELQQRVTRARVGYRKLLRFDGLSGPLWIRRVLVELRALRGLRSARRAAPGAGRKRPDASSPGGATRSAMVRYAASRFQIRCGRFADFLTPYRQWRTDLWRALAPTL